MRILSFACTLTFTVLLFGCDSAASDNPVAPEALQPQFAAANEQGGQPGPWETDRNGNFWVCHFQNPVTGRDIYIDDRDMECPPNFDLMSLEGSRIPFPELGR